MGKLFEKTLAGAAKTAAIATQLRLDKATAAREQCRAQVKVMRDDLVADGKVTADLRADLDAIESAAVEAKRTRRPLPNRAALRAKLEEAEFTENASRSLVEEAEQALVAAQDEFDDATEAHRLATRGDTLARLARALEPAKAIDNELATQNGRCFNIAALIEEIEAAADACACPAVRDIRICCDSANGMGVITRSVPPDLAVREVAAGRWDFNDDRDARRYAAEVDAARAELAKNAAAEAQRRQARAAEGPSI